MGCKTGKSHCFRNRCHVILLKSGGRTSKEVGKITGMSHVSVNSWVHKYKEEGMEGLSDKSGQGRKPLLSKEDGVLLLEIVKSNRQRLQVAKAEWESQSGKSVSRSTLVRFFKTQTVDIKTHKTPV
jgi:transposase